MTGSSRKRLLRSLAGALGLLVLSSPAGVLAQRSAIPDVPPPPPLPKPEKDDSPSTYIRWSMGSFGAGVALAAMGATLAISAESRSDDMENLVRFRNPDGRPLAFEGLVQDRYQNLRSEGKTLGALSAASFVAAGGFVVAGAVFLYLDSKAQQKEKDALTVTPVLGHGRAGVAARWTF